MAQLLTPLLEAGDAIVLTGDLGAGKTFFVQSLLAPLCPDQLVQSPTFSLVNVYQAAHLQVYHADFYRLTSEAELWAAGWEDYLDGRSLLFIEWGQLFPDALPLAYLELEFTITGRDTRTIRLAATGARGQELKREWLNAVASH